MHTGTWNWNRDKTSSDNRESKHLWLQTGCLIYWIILFEITVVPDRYSSVLQERLSAGRLCVRKRKCCLNPNIAYRFKRKKKNKSVIKILCWRLFYSKVQQLFLTKRLITILSPARSAQLMARQYCRHRCSENELKCAKRMKTGICMFISWYSRNLFSILAPRKPQCK